MVKVKYADGYIGRKLEKSTSGASCFDLVSQVNVTILPNSRTLIPSGVFFDIPEGYEVQLRSRSGLALKHGITVLNSPGTIDSDYRGEIGVILINFGEESFTINNGDRIAQAVIGQALGNTYFTLSKVDEINNDTERNEGGFGSTGVK